MSSKGVRHHASFYLCWELHMLSIDQAAGKDRVDTETTDYLNEVTQTQHWLNKFQVLLEQSRMEKY